MNERLKISNAELENLCINTIRTLSIDAVQKANSGHPGAPMALAPVAFTLWDKIMKQNPSNPKWMNRDRFVLSNGHASMLLYSIFHIMGYDVTLDDIKNFRQLDHKCAGHPEYGLIPAIETTTGPLGQGAGNSVGMAIAQKWLAGKYNKPGFNIIDYKIYVIAGDGDMMEGITSEAASIAGHLGLNNLVWIYDNNHITIEGKTDLAFDEDVAGRFKAYHWNIQHLVDANDTEAFEKAIHNANNEKSFPSLIIVDSHIGYGAPHKQDSESAHGSPLGEEEVKGAKKFYGWDPELKFYVPEEVNHHRKLSIERGNKIEGEWKILFEKYRKEHPETAAELEQMQKGELPEGWDSNLTVFNADPKGISGRKASNILLNDIASKVPWLIGGSADLAPSTLTLINKSESIEKDHFNGRNLHFGIREHAMGAIVNGLTLSNLRGYGATFLIFTDYMRPSIRLSALMHIPSLFIMTHDSIGLGEDGPTHQPVEQYASLRAIPNLDFIRPADANEVSVLWKYIMNLKDKPVVIALSRQDLPVFDRNKYASAEGASKGAYVLADCDGTPDFIIMSTGSEVQLCIDAYEQLKKEGIKIRVVSMPCWSLFEEQSEEYKESVLPVNIKNRIAVEAGCELGWNKYMGDKGRFIGLHDFGASGPYKELYKKFGITTENIISTVKNKLV